MDGSKAHNKRREKKRHVGYSNQQNTLNDECFKYSNTKLK